MPGLSSRIIGSGIKNANVQVQGWSSTEFGSDWFDILLLKDLSHPCKTIRLDAVYHAIAEGLEVQLAWKNETELQPIMPLAGRGRIDFSEVSGIHAFLEKPMEKIVLRVLGKPKNDCPCLMLVLDLSLHQGAS